MAGKYDPADFEDRIYQSWIEQDLFHSERNDQQPYTIVIPPPNVTGVLHMGHGLNNTLQDVLIRYHKMRGENALWVPGTDHAGIATQNVVEKKLAKEGKKRHDVGREAFIKEVWKWKEAHGSTIIKQLKKLGAACDWKRERFTMDEGLSHAVLEVFCALHEKGLIYRGQYIINWCPRCGTALSDEEAEHQEIEGSFTHIRYPYADGSGEIVVATTRPETMLGDTAVAVHPKDERYMEKVGTMLILPLTGREIPVIADEHVDMEFGTGAVKVTPAHDPNDFEIGNRHDLPRINVMHEDGSMNENAPEKYRGMDRFTCRKQVVQDLKDQGFFVKQEKHLHSVGHCYRCDTVVEPYLSPQWFVKMAPLAEPAIKAVEEEKIVFYPERWKKVYLNWMHNIRDWCISRQIWWGHQVPAWYVVSETGGKKTKDTPWVVARSEEAALAQAKKEYGNDVQLERDPDVLDTWFSSWLWPFSTLGWPESNPDLEYYYPTGTLVTDMGIIFFWVARMIMAGYFCMGELPFRDVYIHGTVMDDQGRKMSKSLGNGIDPLDVIKEYGADALRYTVVAITPQGQNTLLSMDKFKLGSRFANKIWNASRYILMNVEGVALPAEAVALKSKDPVDRWILSRFHYTVEQVHAAFADYRFNDAASGIFHFFWDDFCDWYIEFTKLRLYGEDDGAKATALGVLLAVLKGSLCLLHPFMPFITEEIYQRLPGITGSIMDAAYPQADSALRDSATEDLVSGWQELITGIRNIRAEMHVPPEKQCRLIFKAENDATEQAARDAEPFVCSLARVEDVSYSRDGDKPAQAAAGVGKGYQYFLPLEGIIDVAAEKARLEKESARLQQELQRVRGKLANKNFTDKAPLAVVDKEREKETHYLETLEKLKSNLESLG